MPIEDKWDHDRDLRKHDFAPLRYCAIWYVGGERMEVTGDLHEIFASICKMGRKPDEMFQVRK
jgi:hypothetical protein